MRAHCLLSLPLVFALQCGGTTVEDRQDGSSSGSGGTNTGGMNTGGTNTAGTETGGGDVGGTGGGVGGTGGTVAPGCAGWGGVGGVSPICDDGVIKGYVQTSEGYCPLHEECTGDTPACLLNSYYVPACGACPGAGGAAVVSIGDACVDETEVTRGDYEAWLVTSPSTAGQSAPCSWNTSFDPDATCMASPDVCAFDCDRHPQPCVDWCDAVAFCASVGKRLCGAYPPHSGYLTVPDPTDFGEACHAGTMQDFPYGSSFVAGACNDATFGQGTTVAVGTLTDCARAHPDGKIHDSVGNVSEWQDDCDALDGAGDPCAIRGGSYMEAESTCQAASTRRRDAFAGDIGFRCCAP